MILQSMQAVIVESARNRENDLDLIMASGSSKATPSTYDAMSDLRDRLRPVCETLLARADGVDAMCQTVVEGCCDLFRESDEACRRYFEGLYSKVLYHQLVSIDPAVQKAEIDAIAGISLFLDTNIVVDLLLASTTEQRATCEVIEISRRLGTKLHITPITLQELDRQIETGRHQVDVAGGLRIGQLVAARPGRGASPFFVEFMQKRRTNRNLTWAGYVAPFKQMESLLRSKGVVVEGAGFDKVTKDAGYERVWRELRSIRFPRYPDYVIDHDAQNFIFVQRLRNHAPKNVLFGTSIWLLTRDSNLARLDQRTAKLYPRRHSKGLDEWGSSMLSFQHLIGFDTADYVGHLLRTNFGISLPEGIDANFAFQLSHPAFDIERLSELDDEAAIRVLISLQGDEEARRLAERLQSADEQEQKEAGRLLSDKAWETLLDEKRRADEQVARLSAEVAALRERIEALAPPVQQPEEVERVAVPERRSGLSTLIRRLFGRN